MTLKRFLLSCLLLLALGWPIRADFITVGGGQVTRINEQTGAVQILNSAAYAYSSLTRDPQTNTFYTLDGIQSPQLFTLDPNTGSRTLVTSLSQSNLLIAALAFAPNGLLYATADRDNTLYTIDPRTGSVARVGSMGGAFWWVYGLAFAPDGTLYGYTNTEGELGHSGPGFFRLDPATAVPTVLTPQGSGGLGNVTAIAFAPNGTLWEASGASFAPISIQTGINVGPSRSAGVRIDGMAFLPAATVPEPSTVLLLGAGLLALCALRRGNQSR